MFVSFRPDGTSDLLHLSADLSPTKLSVQIKGRGDVLWPHNSKNNSENDHVTNNHINTS